MSLRQTPEQKQQMIEKFNAMSEDEYFNHIIEEGLKWAKPYLVPETCDCGIMKILEKFGLEELISFEKMTAALCYRSYIQVEIKDLLDLAINPEEVEAMQTNMFNVSHSFAVLAHTRDLIKRYSPTEAIM